MHSVIAAATPLVRVCRRTPLRTLLFVSASVVALAAAPRVDAQEECGPLAASVTCPVDEVGPNYPNGVTYEPDADFTLDIEDGVSIIGAAGVTVTNSGGNGTVNAPGVTIESGAAGVTADNTGDGDATITAAGTITAATTGLSATTAGAGAASATFESGTISSAGAGVFAGATGAGNASATSGGDVETTGDAADGVAASTVDGTATAESTGAVSTAGAGSRGVAAEAEIGAATATAADVTTLGDGAHGVYVESIEGAASATSTGAIETSGLDAHGMVVIGATDVTVDAGDITTTGQGTLGVVALSTGGSTDVTISGNVQGGWTAGPVALPTEAPATPLPTGLPYSAGLLAAAADGEEPGSVTITNNGEVGALSDVAILAFGPSIVVDNAGAVTGYVGLYGDTVTFNNLSSDSFDMRNFADTDGDGVRDTEALALSDFGGNGTFNNEAGGAVVLLNVEGPTVWDTTGALLPEIGDPADYDITLDGVEQAHLVGLTQFNNLGAIIMQDVLGGGAEAVAGDVIAILGIEDAPATFVTGGGLYLDTVLNEGGAAASQSDVLILEATALGGTGATRVFIENAGGLGAQTIEDGILVVDVLNPDMSVANAFQLGDYVIAGGYQYQLYQGGDAEAGGDPSDGNWYLRSNISPTVDVYRAYPASLMRSTRTAVGTLQQRLGNRWWRVPEQRVERTVTDPAPPPQAVAPQTREFVVFFDWDRYDLKPEAMATIREATDYAKTGAATRIIVLGHTDTSGPEDYNMALSERRARAVSDAIQAQGVAAQVIGMEWFGETQPAIDTGDGVREARNRRAYIQVSVPGAVASGPPPAPRTRTVVDVVPPSTEIQGAGVWGRVLGTTAEYDFEEGTSDVDEDSFLFQAGVDFVVNQTENSRLIAGISGHYGEASSDVANDAFGDIATIDSTGAGASVSLTWYNQDGTYIDGVLSGTWYDTDIDSDELGVLASGNEAVVWALSIEGGKRFQVRPNYYWVPQAQLIYTSADVDDFTDAFGADVEDRGADSLLGRLGVSYEYLNRTTQDDGNVHRVQGYVIGNLLYEFTSDSGAAINGVSFDEDVDKLWGEIGMGWTYSVTQAWTFYGEGAYRTSLENFGDSHALQGSVGLRFNW